MQGILANLPEMSHKRCLTIRTIASAIKMKHKSRASSTNRAKLMREAMSCITGKSGSRYPKYQRAIKSNTSNIDRSMTNQRAPFQSCRLGQSSEVMVRIK